MRIRSFWSGLLLLAAMLGLIRPAPRHRAHRPGDRQIQHTGADLTYAAELHQYQTIEEAPELRPAPPELTILHTVRAELDPIDRAIAEFSVRIDAIVSAFTGPLEQTGELDLTALRLLLDDEPEPAPVAPGVPLGAVSIRSRPAAPLADGWIRRRHHHPPGPCCDLLPPDRPMRHQLVPPPMSLLFQATPDPAALVS